MAKSSRDAVLHHITVAMDFIATVMNVVFLLICVFAFTQLWSLTWRFIDLAGGSPLPAHFTAVLEAPDKPAELQILGNRAYWWVQAWVAGVFAAGFALLSIAGGRWAWVRVQRSLI